MTNVRMVCRFKGVKLQESTCKLLISEFIFFLLDFFRFSQHFNGYPVIFVNAMLIWLAVFFLRVVYIEAD
jgi:hypothetical protein